MSKRKSNAYLEDGEVLKSNRKTNKTLETHNKRNE